MKILSDKIVYVLQACPTFSVEGNFNFTCSEFSLVDYIKEKMITSANLHELMEMEICYSKFTLDLCINGRIYSTKNYYQMIPNHAMYDQLSEPTLKRYI